MKSIEERLRDPHLMYTPSDAIYGRGYLSIQRHLFSVEQSRGRQYARDHIALHLIEVDVSIPNVLKICKISHRRLKKLKYVVNSSRYLNRYMLLSWNGISINKEEMFHSHLAYKWEIVRINEELDDIGLCFGDIISAISVDIDDILSILDRIYKLGEYGLSMKQWDGYSGEERRCFHYAFERGRYIEKNRAMNNSRPRRTRNVEKQKDN